MEPILKEFNRLSQSKGFDKCISQIDKFMKSLEVTKSRILSDPSKAGIYIKELASEVDILSEKVKTAEKEIHSGISKFGKSLDKVFKLDLSSAKLFPLEPSGELDKAILMHLARSGYFDIAYDFRDEAHVTVSDDLLSQFSVMYEVVSQIQNKNLEPAIHWATARRRQLLDRGSNLEFILHKVEFIRILQEDSDVLKALAYAQSNMSYFGERHLSEISKLMSSVLYYKTASSPYSNLFDVPSHEKLSWMFSAEFCSLIGLSPESPVYLAVLAGTMALPVLAKMGAVMKTKSAEWTSANELPTEIELPPSLIFHQIFVCPVSKEQTTETNPPKLLPCGHILADQSLASMKSTVPGKIKCPYCPMASMYSEARQVYF